MYPRLQESGGHLRILSVVLVTQAEGTRMRRLGIVRSMGQSGGWRKGLEGSGAGKVGSSGLAMPGRGKAPREAIL